MGLNLSPGCAVYHFEQDTESLVRGKNISKNCARGLFPLLVLQLFVFAGQLAGSGLLASAQGSQPTPAGPVRAWVDAAASNQAQLINQEDNIPVRYRIHKVDAKGSSTREVIETREGTVARLMERNGAPLTADENNAERQRLQDILDSPSSFLGKRQRERGARSYALELIRNMPQAMIWTYAPGQPQLPNARGAQIVVDFVPDPKFKPPTIITEGLTGIAGRIWIDAETRCVVRIQGHILHPVDFGWGGFLARISEGGTVELEQAEASDRRWLYSHLSEHLTIREVMVHTVRENTVMDASDVHVLPAPVSFRDAIRALLAMPVPTR